MKKYEIVYEAMTLSFDRLQSWLRNFYQNTLRSPDYILFSPEGYDTVMGGFSTIDRIKLPGPESKEWWIQLANYANGAYFYVATLPDMPRCKEFSHAHLAFAEAEYEKLPTLKPHEMLAIFPQNDNQ